MLAGSACGANGLKAMVELALVILAGIVYILVGSVVTVLGLRYVEGHTPYEEEWPILLFMVLAWPVFVVIAAVVGLPRLLHRWWFT